MTAATDHGADEAQAVAELLLRVESDPALAFSEDLIAYVRALPRDGVSFHRIRNVLKMLSVPIVRWDAVVHPAKASSKPRPAKPALADDDRPIVRISVELHEVVDRGVEVLGADPDLFQRDGALVHVVRADGEADRVAWERETPQIRPLVAAALRERLTRNAQWHRKDPATDTWRASMPSTAVVEALLARGEWPGVRQLVGIIEAPAPREDGSIIETPGHDPATGYLYVPNANFGRIPSSPTQASAAAALEQLREVFCDFPYRAPVDLDVAIACILTILARPAIRGSVPGFLFDASTRGSGKTLQADAVSVIASGRGAPRMSWPTEVTELEKVLGSYALRGANIIVFDNIVGGFYGAPLDRCLTAENRVALRVLGKSKIPELPWRATVIGTGNNIETRGDTTRRVLLSRLQPEQERPELRSGFRHPDLLGWVRQERPRLVRAALTIVAAYVAVGRPRTLSTSWGSFEAWTALVPQAIAFAGGEDVLAARPTEADGHDPEAAALVAVHDAIERLDQGPGVTVRELVERLYTAERVRGEKVPPDGFDDARGAIELLVPTKPRSAPDTTRLAGQLKRYRGRIVGGRSLVTRPGRAGVVRWGVTRAGGVGGVGWVDPTLSPISRARLSQDPNLERGWITTTNPTNPTTEVELDG